ncbi:MAG: restriction endonuclease subunit S [Verrucomicrobia bacterium]|nr:restriction endonuclease subunit S [Deltaproteobacteria bacterium]
MRWQNSTLGEIAKRDGGLIQTGPFGAQLHQADYKSEGIPVIMPKDIADGRVSVESIALISEEMANRLERHKLKPRTIVLPRRGEITKRAFIRAEQEGWLCGTGCLKIELSGKELAPEFLYYFMEQGHVVQWLLQHAVGTTMLNLSAGIVSQLPVRFPSVEAQHEIASTLSTYDDLIENNRRRMALLEDAARQVYQEWFVRLRFPGREHTRIVVGVPEGWERMPLESALVLQRGFDLPSQDRSDGSVPIYASTGVNGTHNVAKAKAPGIVTGRSGSLGMVHYVHEDYWPLNTTLWVKEFRRVSPIFAYFLLSSLHLDQYNGGVSVPTLDRKVVHKIEVVVPDGKTQALFGDSVLPMFTQIRNLGIYNDKLRTARDLLLPKLMSGEISV